MSQRRVFLKQLGLLTSAFTANSLFQQAYAADIERAQQTIAGFSPEQAAADEDFWSVISQAYTVNPSIINLNNGGVSPSPKVVQDAVERFNQLSNQAPSYYMWRILDQGREPLRMKLANLAGADPEEIAVNRNATEALNTVIFGLDQKAGDEVIGTKQDYPNMIQAWRQREMREGIKYTQISFNFPIEEDAAIVDAFAKAITSKTKVLHITHVVNWVGQILPGT